MKIGVSIPQTDMGSDPMQLRDFAQAAEAIGFAHLATYDHVVGINPQSRPDWSGPCTSKHAFHDPFGLFGFLAGQTKSIVLTTHILILPQRQTALVARQAATIDVLSNGRLRLGIGIGKNPVEFTVLGENFDDRGQRSEEQVRLMQALWTQDHVTFEGRWHEVPDVGLNPRPVQQPIPIWFGGHHENVLRRIATIGDGWIILAHRPDNKVAAEIDRLRGFVREANRPIDAVGIDAWVSMGGTTPDDWRAEVTGWGELGVSHVTLNTAFERMHHRPIDNHGLDAHIDAMRRYHEAVHDLL
jgi:probable F420-dependent oxidoreductase